MKITNMISALGIVIAVAFVWVGMNPAIANDDMRVGASGWTIIPNDACCEDDAPGSSTCPQGSDASGSYNCQPNQGNLTICQNWTLDDDTGFECDGKGGNPCTGANPACGVQNAACEST